MFSKVLLIFVVLIVTSCQAFRAVSAVSNRLAKANLKMEYIPDGMTKAQWEAIKKKEAEANKGKNLGETNDNLTIPFTESEIK